MNLLQNKKVLLSLLKQGDVLNDINGGHAQTDVRIVKGDDAFGTPGALFNILRSSEPKR